MRPDEDYDPDFDERLREFALGGGFRERSPDEYPERAYRRGFQQGLSLTLIALKACGVEIPPAMSKWSARVAKWRDPYPPVWRPGRHIVKDAPPAFQPPLTTRRSDP
jgi:hypothetical protein